MFFVKSKFMLFYFLLFSFLFLWDAAGAEERNRIQFDKYAFVFVTRWSALSWGHTEVHRSKIRKKAILWSRNCGSTRVPLFSCCSYKNQFKWTAKVRRPSLTDEQNRNNPEERGTSQQGCVYTAGALRIAFIYEHIPQQIITIIGGSHAAKAKEKRVAFVTLSRHFNKAALDSCEHWRSRPCNSSFHSFMILVV